MEHLALIGTVTVLHILAVISPGPDFFIAMRNAITYSRRAGIYTSIGIGLGLIIHIAYSIAGLALIISQSILLFNFIKYLGAAYLVYIGLKSFFSKTENVQEVTTEKKQSDISAFKALRMGFLTNILNPKATMYFLSIFTLVITPDLPAHILGLLSLIMIGFPIMWFSLVAVFFTNSHFRKLFNRFQAFFNKIFGGILVALGIKVALSKD